MLGIAVLPASAISVAAYDHALDEVQSALSNQVQSLRADQVPSGEAPLLAAQRILGPVHSIETPDGTSYLVDTAPLIESVRAADGTHGSEAKEAAFETVTRQIALLRRSLVRNDSRGESLSAEAERSAKAVLAGEEFASDPPPPPSVIDRALESLDRWLSKLFSSGNTNNNLPPMQPISPLFLKGIFFAIVAASFAALVFVLVKVIGQRGVKARPLGLEAEEAALVEARDSESLLALAEKQAKAGEYRLAFRLIYLAALVALDSGGALRFDPSKTNWEYLRALRSAGRGDIAEALMPMTRQFDLVWYGFSRTDAGHYAEALIQYHALLAAPQSSQNLSAARNVMG